jgi:hypothetical protein
MLLRSSSETSFINAIDGDNLPVSKAWLSGWSTLADRVEGL